MATGTLLAAIDCGTTAIKAGILDLRGNTVGMASRQLPCVHSPDGRVEQDPRQITRVAAVSVATRRATLWGAAILSGYGIRGFASLEEGVHHMVRLKDTFAPVLERVVKYERVYQKSGFLIAQVKKPRLFRPAAN